MVVCSSQPFCLGKEPDESLSGDVLWWLWLLPVLGGLGGGDLIIPILLPISWKCRKGRVFTISNRAWRWQACDIWQATDIRVPLSKRKTVVGNPMASSWFYCKASCSRCQWQSGHAICWHNTNFTVYSNAGTRWVNNCSLKWGILVRIGLANRGT